MFQDETAYSNPIECQPSILGRQIKDALRNCRRIDKTEKEMRAVWAQTPYMPFHVSAAKTLDKFYSAYYPIAVYCKDRKFWIAAAFSQKLDLPAQAVDKNCKDEILGTEVMKLMQRVQSISMRA